jgi:hypothetical protein
MDQIVMLVGRPTSALDENGRRVLDVMVPGQRGMML